MYMMSTLVRGNATYLIKSANGSFVAFNWNKTTQLQIATSDNLLQLTSQYSVENKIMGRGGRDYMVVGFTTTCAISADRH